MSPNDRPAATGTADQQSRPEPASHPPRQDGALFGRLGQQGAEAWQYLQYYASAKLDGAKLAVRQATQKLVLALAAGLVGIGILIVAGTFFIAGLAEGLGLLLGAAWLGKLLAGLAILVLFGLAIGAGLTLANRRSYRATRAKYEQRQHQQRTRFGHDVTD